VIDAQEEEELRLMDELYRLHFADDYTPEEVQGQVFWKKD
jgi:hypothetical protein